MWGRKKLLLGGIAIAAIGATGCVARQRLPLVSGVSHASRQWAADHLSLSQALIQDLFAGRERERLRIWMVTGGGVFISISPLLGTWLQLHLGWQGSFYVFIALAVIVWLRCLACCSRKPRAVAPCRPERFFSAYWRLCSDVRFMGYWLISALAFACHFSFIVIFADHFHGASGALAVRIRLGVVAVWRGLCVRRGSRQRRCIDACRPTRRSLSAWA